MKYDIDEIKTANPIADVIGRVVELSTTHGRLKGCCPFHDDKTPSMVVYEDHYHCFSCDDAHGDVIDFTSKYHGVGFKEACEILGGERKAPNPEGRVKRVKAVIKSIYDGIEPIMPVPADAILLQAKRKTPEIWNPNRDKFTAYKPSMVFEYHNSQGQLIGYVLRIDFEDGGKITPSIMWCEWGEGKQGWCHYSIPEPRPLYGVSGLSLNPDAPVMVVEGEKCRDSAHRLMPQYVCVSWAGGTNAVDKADWRSLAGRETVVIWADMDEPGIKAADKIRKILLALNVHSIKQIGLDESKPKGWDVADAEAEKITRKQIVAWAAPLIKTYDQPKMVEPETIPLEAYADEYGEMVLPDEEETEVDVPIDDNKSFKCLGHLNNVFFYLPNNTGEVLNLSPGKHNQQHLLILADLLYWQEMFPGKVTPKWHEATDALYKEQKKRGFFDGHSRIRGRGAWLDEGRPLLHLGNKVHLEGTEYLPQKVPSKFIYQGGPSLPINITHPATNKEANKFAELCCDFLWDKPISGHLLAGWCIVASVCGVLKWRPHVWITGAQGNGKSTILNKVCKIMLENIAVICDGNTTEAGLRHFLGQDARPVIMDEAEAETQQTRQAMQGILGLVRYSSSGGKILKGSSDGMGQSYSVRSSFCFASINPAIAHSADEARISVMVLNKGEETRDASERWNNLLISLESTITKEFAESMFARTLKHIKTLQANVDVFRTAVVREFNNARLADQIGTMLAGTFLCYSTKEVTLTNAVEWIKKQDWEEILSVLEKPDDARLIDTLATSRIRMVASGRQVESTIGELILNVESEWEDGSVLTQDQAQDELKRYGIIVEDGWIYIANRSRPLSVLLKDTSWGHQWGRSLQDIKGAEKAPSRYYAPGIQSRGTRIPVGVLKEG